MSEVYVFMFPGLNPEPWEVGPVGWRTEAGGKRVPTIGPVAKLKNYQLALATELKRVYPGAIKLAGHVRIEMYFWRRMDSGTTGTNRHADAKISDSTNMQKATEDAIQGVLIYNDRQTKDIRSVIVEEGPYVDPAVLIKIAEIAGPSKVSLDAVLFSEFERRRKSAFDYADLDKELRVK